VDWWFFSPLTIHLIDITRRDWDIKRVMINYVRYTSKCKNNVIRDEKWGTSPKGFKGWMIGAYHWYYIAAIFMAQGQSAIVAVKYIQIS